MVERLHGGLPTRAEAAAADRVLGIAFDLLDRRDALQYALAIALDLANAFTGADVVFTLIRDGDHRLSRPDDIERLIAAVEEML